MENLRERVDVWLVRSHEEDKLRRLIASLAFARANIFDDDLAAIQIHRGPGFDTRSGNILSFSFRFFKKGSCQILPKVCARSTG